MERIRAATLIAVGLFSSGASAADERDVQSLLMQCNSANVNEFMQCLQYVGGASDVMVMNGAIIKMDPSIDQRMRLVAMCPAVAVTLGATRQAFINWAEQHPEEWTTDKGQGVLKALRQVWPCP